MARRIQVEIVGDARSLERAFNRAHTAGNKFGRTLRGLATAASVGFGGAVIAAGFALRAGFKELADSQKVVAQTGAVLRSTGGIANVTAKDVTRLADSISHKSGIDDEAVASAENLLLTFTKIRNETGKGNDIFNRATTAVADMSTALGRDLFDTAMMVGKALNQMDVTAQGNVRGFMALRRVGVQITPAMMKQAAAFIAAGKPMKAQQLLLRELTTEFGGSARAFGTTMPGALGKLRNSFDELTAAFAQGFLPIILKVANALTKKMMDPAFVARVTRLGTLVGTKLYNAFVSISTWFGAHWPQIREGFRTAAVTVGVLIKAVRTLSRLMLPLARVAAGSFRLGFILPMQLVLKMISGILEALTHLPFVGGQFKGALESVNAMRESVGQIAAASQGLAMGGRHKAPKRGPGPPLAQERKGGRGGIAPHSIGDVYLDREKVGKIVLNDNHRRKNRHAGQTRGRLGGDVTAHG